MTTPAKTPESPKVDPIPPPKGWAKVWKHLKDWATSYFWVPLMFFMIWVFAQGAYFLTGRRPQENVDWIVDIARALVVGVCIVLVMEIKRQQTSHWWPAEKLEKYPHIAWSQTVTSCVTFVALVYLFTH